MSVSYLDETIALVQTQIAVLDAATRSLEDRPGPAMDVGLGNGRTYSHLCEKMPDRKIFAFDTSLKAATASIPPADQLILGDIRETMAFALPRMKERAIFVHCDISTGDPTANLATEAWLSICLAPVTAVGAVAVSRLKLHPPFFEPLADCEIGLKAGEAPLLGQQLFVYRATSYVVDAGGDGEGLPALGEGLGPVT